MGAVLHAIEIPPVGGDTLFSDMNAAYEGLSDEMKARIEGLTAPTTSCGPSAPACPTSARPRCASSTRSSSTPSCVTHDATGQTPPLRQPDLHRVASSASTPTRAPSCSGSSAARPRPSSTRCRFRWQPDSVAFWDNRAVQHYASSDYWPERRVMERASIIGGRAEA